MEFRLPEQLANKLVNYDQTLKQTEEKKEKFMKSVYSKHLVSVNDSKMKQH